MKINFDKEADALYLKLNDRPIVDSEEVLPGVNYDYDETDRVVGIEVLDIKEQPLDLYKKLDHLITVEDRNELASFFRQLAQTL